jgi:hypothetical protein
MGPARSHPDSTIRAGRTCLTCSFQRARLVCCAKKADRLLENSCHDRGNRCRPRCRDSFAKQKARHTAITGNSPEFLGSGDRRHRNSIYGPGRKLSGNKLGGHKLSSRKLGTDKPANCVINPFRFESIIIPRIF